jgi:excisionase family DNA binding protein
MRIAEFARRLGVSRDTLRRWERRGLIAPSRDWAGHRRFTQADFERLRPLVHGGACREDVPIAD